MKRVLVTGAAGFIGRHTLAPLAARGFEVHAVGGQGSLPEADAAAWHRVDLLDRGQASALVRRVAPTHVLHLAWYAVPGLFWHAPENAAWVDATASLVDAAEEAGVHRVVGAGTCAEYDWSGGVCDEASTPIRPSTPYGRAKAAASAALLARAGRFPDGCAWGRVFFLYGPHEPSSRLVASIMRAVLAGEPAPVTEGSQRRDFLHVQDVADGFVALTDSSVTGPVNISSGEAVSVGAIAFEAARAAGRPELLRVGALADRPDDPPLIVGPQGRLSREAGWAPQVALGDGLAACARFWRSQVDEGRARQAASPANGSNQ